MFIEAVVVSVIATCGTILAIGTVCAAHLRWTRRQRRNNGRQSIAFFHLHCAQGGGGEKVLWQSIDAMFSHSRMWRDITIYVADNVNRSTILASVKARFGLSFAQEHHSIRFVPIYSWWLCDPDTWKIATLMGQSIGSMIVAMECLLKWNPDTVIDTVGFAFIYPLFRYLGGCNVGCYVHYPTITSNMIEPVNQCKTSVNNSQIIANSALLTNIKLQYYKIFAWLYSKCGSNSQAVMVNSKWTEAHIVKLWPRTSPHLVYPPCDVQSFSTITDKRDPGAFLILSVAQFRPEKRLDFQLKIFKLLLEERRHNGHDIGNIKWCFIGSCRNEDDVGRLNHLKYLGKRNEFPEHSIEFMLNCSYEDLKQKMSEATIGVHTMIEEHFGIAIVECMAAGMIMIAHGSGGPLSDIITSSDNGFTAVSKEEYVDRIEQVMNMTVQQRAKLRGNAKRFVEKFDSSLFQSRFVDAIEKIVE